MVALRVAMDFTRSIHLCAHPSELKGKSLNPSAHDQTCFIALLIQKRILFIFHFCHIWALMKSVTLPFISEYLHGVNIHLHLFVFLNFDAVRRPQFILILLLKFEC